jgi:uncharacterized protein (DUF608 family)
MGAIIRLYRDWKLSGDTDWLRAMWPAAKRALEWSWAGGGWDPNADGVMEGEQHTTYDVEFYGPNPMVEGLYLGALRAAAAMARAVDDEASATYQALEAAGSEAADVLLWNGEYYEQSVRVLEETIDRRERKDWHSEPWHSGELEPSYQHAAGCLADQLIGQWLCHVAGLGYVFPTEHVRTALEAVVRHNWKADLSEHESCQRTYALNDEPGLLLCTWPRGGRPIRPFPYADEIWSGVEYQVAAHLIYEGAIADGIRIVEGVRSRHDGEKRNPWDEPECGHHYVRALSSWSLLLALSGYEYDAIERRLRFSPRVSANGFRTLFTTGSAWGVYSQQIDARSQSHTLRILGGEVTLEVLEIPDNDSQSGVRRERLDGRSLGPGETVNVRFSRRGHDD